MSNPQFKIVSYPDFKCITPKAIVSYHAEPVDPDKGSTPKGTSFRWACVNDASTKTDTAPNIFKGPSTQNWKEAHWDFAGRHSIVLYVTHPDGKKDVYEREQWVDTASNILGREFDPKANDALPGPFQVLKHKEMTHKVLLDIAKVKPPPDNKKEAHEKQVEENELYIGHLKTNLEGLEGKESFVIDAMHMDRERSQRTQLLLYLVNTMGENKKPSWTMVDWTNPMYKFTTGVYQGSGKTHEDAIKNLLSEWDSENRYPDGVIKYEMKIPVYGIDTTGEIKTDGKSFWDELSSWFDYVALGGAVVAGVATLVLPVPGSRVVSAAIWTSILTSSAAATINIAQRHSEGFGNWKDDAFDGLSIVGNLFAGAGAWKIGAKVTSAKHLAGQLTKTVLIGQVSTDGLQGILLGEKYLSDFNAIMDDTALAPGDRMKKIMELLRSAAIAGALTYVSIKGTTADLNNLNNNRTLLSKADMENPDTVIKLDEPVSSVPVKRSEETIETLVENEPKNKALGKEEVSAVSRLKHMKGDESRFSRDLEDLVKERAQFIIDGKGGKNRIGKKNAVATSRSGIEELDYKSPDFENLGGKKQFSEKNMLPGLDRNIQNETFQIKTEKDLKDYMTHVKKIYKKKLKTIYKNQAEKTQLHPYMIELIEDYIRKTKKSVDNNFSDHNGGPGLHAEIQAVNDVYNELSVRGIDPRTYDFSKIEVVTYKVKDMKIAGEPFKACKNCKGILIETMNILTGRVE